MTPAGNINLAPTPNAAPTQNQDAQNQPADDQLVVDQDEITTPAANKKLDKSSKRWVWWSWLPLAGVIASIIDKIIPKKDDDDEDEKDKKKEDKDQK